MLQHLTQSVIIGGHSTWGVWSGSQYQIRYVTHRFVIKLGNGLAHGHFTWAIKSETNFRNPEMVQICN